MNHERTNIFYTYVKLWSGHLIWICIWVFKIKIWIGSEKYDMGVWTRCFRSLINSFGLVVWSIIMRKWTTNPIIQCYFKLFQSRIHLFRKIIWIHSFRQKMYNHSNQVMIQRTKPVSTVVADVSEAKCVRPWAGTVLTTKFNIFIWPSLAISYYKILLFIIYYDFFHQMFCFKMTKEIVGNLSALPEN